MCTAGALSGGGGRTEGRERRREDGGMHRIKRVQFKDWASASPQPSLQDPPTITGSRHLWTTVCLCVCVLVYMCLCDGGGGWSACSCVYVCVPVCIPNRLSSAMKCAG